MLRIATRGSALARWQAEEVGRLLAAARPGLQVELVVVDTAGDRRTDVPVWQVGGQGIFVKEVESALLRGEADLAVHSAKDLPSLSAPGLAICAVPPRGDPRDALVGGRLADLPPGAVVATGSVRRRAQLAWLRPDLSFTGLRGNIATRLSKCPPGGAVVVAAAALERLGLAAPVPPAGASGGQEVRTTVEAAAGASGAGGGMEVDILAPSLLLPQVGQGALAVQCRSEDVAAAELVSAIDDRDSHRALNAERAFLARLGGGCDLPVGAYATVDAEGKVEIEGLLASLDGRILLRQRLDSGHGGGSQDAGDAALGVAVAEALLGAGGEALLAGFASPGGE